MGCGGCLREAVVVNMRSISGQFEVKTLESVAPDLAEEIELGLAEIVHAVPTKYPRHELADL